MTKTKQRLDRLLVEQGRFRTRSQAHRMIMAGNVFVNGKRVDKPGTQVGVNAKIEVRGKNPYVSRGGLKLVRALEVFRLDVRGRTAVDIGASTGGFTDCLLRQGVVKVWAVDVGYGQLDWKLRNDPRVVVLERTNARHLRPEDIGAQVDLATIDVSFISLKKILPPLRGIVRPGGTIVALVKPQFEAGREFVKRGGRVTDPEVHVDVLGEICRYAEEIDLSVSDAMFSPITGPAGNIEFFLYLENVAGRSKRIDLVELVSSAHRTLI
ncbi:MAG: TlyA family RNA methyltransferase [Candidatus Bipolaricaulia bacterium]